MSATCGTGKDRVLTEYVPCGTSARTECIRHSNYICFPIDMNFPEQLQICPELVLLLGYFFGSRFTVTT
jgi:hypothetical protein